MCHTFADPFFSPRAPHPKAEALAEQKMGKSEKIDARIKKGTYF